MSDYKRLVILLDSRHSIAQTSSHFLLTLDLQEWTHHPQFEPGVVVPSMAWAYGWPCRTGPRLTGPVYPTPHMEPTAHVIKHLLVYPHVHVLRAGLVKKALFAVDLIRERRQRPSGWVVAACEHECVLDLAVHYVCKRGRWSPRRDRLLIIPPFNN